MKIGKYWKTVVAAVGAAAYVLEAALSDNTVTTFEWVGIGVAVLTAFGVWRVPNKPEEPALRSRSM